MRKSSLVPALLVLLLACGLSFGAGYFMALKQEPPPRPEIALEPPDQPILPADQPDPVHTSTQAPLPQPSLPEPMPEVHTTTDATEEPNVIEVQPTAKPSAEPGASNIERVMPTLELGPEVDLAATILGTVVDARGAPVAGAQIHGRFSESFTSGGSAMRFSVSSAGGAGQQLATSDAGGAFRIDLSRKIREGAALAIALTAAKDGYAESATVNISIRNGETRDGIRLVLRESGSISGRVVDDAGRGVAGARVSLGGGGPRVSGVVIDSFQPRGGLSAVTDASGEFRIDGVPEGRHSFVLQAAGYRQLSGPSTVEARAGIDVRAAVDFVVAQTTSVSVTLRDSDGNPLRGWATLVFKDGAGNDAATLRGAVGEDGVFTANDPPVGSYRVSVSLFGYQAQEVHATVLENSVAELGVVILMPAPRD
jgi:protocatechuate 3,4-dioxygenase beta subunit